jgi:hypothetical protein
MFQTGLKIILLISFLMGLSWAITAQEDDHKFYLLIMRNRTPDFDHDIMYEQYWRIDDWEVGSYTPLLDLEFAGESASIFSWHFVSPHLYRSTGTCYSDEIGQLVRINWEDQTETVLHEQPYFCYADMLDEDHWQISYFPPDFPPGYWSRSREAPYVCLLDLKNSECPTTEYTPVYWLDYNRFLTPYIDRYGQAADKWYLGSLETTELSEAFPAHFQFIAFIVQPDSTPRLISDNTQLVLVIETDTETNKAIPAVYILNTETLELSKQITLNIPDWSRSWTLSPDGRYLLNDRSDDFVIMDFSTGDIVLQQTRIIKNDNLEGYIIPYIPDYLAWLPDSSGVIGQVKTSDAKQGGTVVRIDVETGEIVPLFNMEYNVTFVLAPVE